MFGREIGSLELSHGIGQTPCSYERYLRQSDRCTEKTITKQKADELEKQINNPVIRQDSSKNTEDFGT